MDKTPLVVRVFYLVSVLHDFDPNGWGIVIPDLGHSPKKNNLQQHKKPKIQAPGTTFSKFSDDVRPERGQGKCCRFDPLTGLHQGAMSTLPILARSIHSELREQKNTYQVYLPGKDAQTRRGCSGSVFAVGRLFGVSGIAKIRYTCFGRKSATQSINNDRSHSLQDPCFWPDWPRRWFWLEKADYLALSALPSFQLILANFEPISFVLIRRCVFMHTSYIRTLISLFVLGVMCDVFQLLWCVYY